MLKTKSVFLKDLGIFKIPECVWDWNINSFDLSINGAFSERYKDWKLREKQEPLPACEVNVREMIPNSSFVISDLYEMYRNMLRTQSSCFGKHMLEENRIIQIMRGRGGSEIIEAIGDNGREELIFPTVPNGWPHKPDNAFAFSFSYEFDPGNHATTAERNFNVQRFSEEISVNPYFKAFFFFKV